MYNNYKKPFTPKKPVRSFRDLEVYQKTLEAGVIAAKDLRPKLAVLECVFTDDLIKCTLALPLVLCEAHSRRFGNHSAAIEMLERTMVGCNKMIVYLEQAKGLYGAKLDIDLIDDLIRRYVDVRIKIFRLEKSWQTWYEPKK